MAMGPQTLWIVRRRNLPEYGWFPRKSAPFRMEAAFATQQDALAFQEQREREEAATGNWEPLFALGSLDAIMRLSDFEPPVFRDWLVDSGILDPLEQAEWWDEPWDQRAALDAWRGWFAGLRREQVSALYAGLHRFRFFELIEVPFVSGAVSDEQLRGWVVPPPTHWEDPGWEHPDDYADEPAQPWDDPPANAEDDDAIPF